MLPTFVHPSAQLPSAHCPFSDSVRKGWETARVLVDKGYDSDAVLETVAAMQAEAVIPPKANRVVQREYDKQFYRERHLVECFFNKLKQFRREQALSRCRFALDRVFSRFDQTA